MDLIFGRCIKGSTGAFWPRRVVSGLPACALVVLLLTALFTLTACGSKVPDLTGLTLPEASEVAEEAKLLIGTTVESYDATVPAGQIISQNPPMGEDLPEGAKIDIVVSKGPEPIAVPDVVGKSQTDAVANSSGPDRAFVLSRESLDYAASLGGTSQEGETLYFVIGASLDSEQAAQSRLQAALSLFGDMQPYFIVQKSDNFDGMRPGWWVIIEAFRERPSQENLDFGRRGFPDAYVKRATVRTADPIPVYEDLVSGY